MKKRHSFMGIANSEMGSATVDASPLGGGGGRDDSESRRRDGKGSSAGSAALAKDKFKSMGSLQMEPSLPPAPM